MGPLATVVSSIAFSMVAPLCRLFDRLEHWWDRAETRRALGTLLVLLFFVSLAGIEANRRGWLPPRFERALSSSHVAAVGPVFTVLLLSEVASVIVVLPRSVADSVGKQFELLALILMREAFLELASVGEPMEWPRVVAAVPRVLADMLGALALFAILSAYYRAQRHQAITTGEREQVSFVCAKKVVALALLLVFGVLGIRAAWLWVARAVLVPFFATFYTVLVLSDVLLLLISLRYSTSFRVLFRNAGFAAATVVARLALSAPAYYNALLGAAAAFFALVLTWTYNTFVAAPGSATDGRGAG